MKARVTISRTSSFGGESDITISVEDDSNGLNIIKVSLDAANFAKAITGLSNIKADIERPPTYKMIDHLGKNREVKDIFVDKVNACWGKHRKPLILLALEIEAKKPEWKGWTLFEDGLKTQQNETMHKATMHRYVERR